jgi:hypothetical protein
MERYIAFLTMETPLKASADTASLSGHYGSLSWTDILCGKFEAAIQAAQAGIKLDPNAYYIKANMAHGLLLTGKTEEAKQLYMEVRTQKLGERSLVDATKEDFETMKLLGYGNPEMDSILQQMSGK